MFLQRVAEAEVLCLQRLAAGRLALPRTDVIGDHAGRDLQDAHASAQDFRRLCRQVHRKRTHELALEANRHAKEAYLFAIFLRPVENPVLEPRLGGNAWNHRRLSGFDDLPDDTFSDAVTGSAYRRLGSAMSSLDREFLAIGKQQHHRATKHPESPLHGGQHRGQQLLLRRLFGDQLGNFGEKV